jgi:tRNA(fMet)-specific endonuclease VapC
MGRGILEAVSTLDEIEKAVAALPRGQQEILLRQLTIKLATPRRRGSTRRKQWPVPPPKVNKSESRRIAQRIEDEFGRVELEVILDTNAISAWCDGEAALLAVLPADRPLFLPVISLGEYRFGIKVARDRKAREAWLTRVESALTVLEVDSETARFYAEVREELRRAATPIPENDVWIAALARQHYL